MPTIFGPLAALWRSSLDLGPTAIVTDGTEIAPVLIDGDLQPVTDLHGAQAGDQTFVLLLLLACSREAIAQTAALLAPGGVLIVMPVAGTDALELEACARRSFPSVDVYLASRTEADLLFRREYAHSRIAALNGVPVPDTTIILCSDAVLPVLKTGLSALGDSSTPMPGEQAPRPWPLVQADHHVTTQRQAIALANRLLDQEQRYFELLAQNRSGLHEGGGRDRDGIMGFPLTSFGWPTREARDGSTGFEDPYDHRPDDPVIACGREGAAFLGKHALLGAADRTPDIAAAIEEINGTHGLNIVDEAGSVPPDVSIVIPVYGQLPYTFNCLHSLVAHRSRHSVEVIVVDDCSPDPDTARWLPLVDRIRYHRQPANGGFIRSSNAGAALARGRHLVMLNNDTRVADGWLDALIDSFADFPNAGAVGSKMFYPDGSLQEAGGLLWRDGSAWNYGHGDDPNRPQYCHARQVDYVSGCSLAFPTELWRQLGGFDEHFAPAYCEDADLCLRIRAAGRQTWFQPMSRLVHYEGKTSGTSTSGGVKAYQLVNTGKLFLRWRELFDRHKANGEAAFYERERDVRRRILVVDATTPTPGEDAGSVQTVLALRTCLEAGYKPYFIPEHNYLFQRGITEDLQKLGVECVYAPFERNFDDYIQRYGRLFDVVLVYRMTVLGSIIDSIRKYAPQASLMYHVADLHHLREQREAMLLDDEEALAAAGRTREIELDLVARADCTITHSQFEADILAKEVPDASVVVWPLAVSHRGTEKGFAERRDLCFLGGYGHAPNVDAVRYFVDAIWPLIKQQQPDLRFIVAGANPTREIEALSRDDIVVTGRVEDLTDLFDPIRLFVAPLRYGAGVKGKILSALSHGLPTVSTQVGVEGSGLEHEKHLLVADDPVAFASAVLRLYRDKRLWKRLSDHGQTYVHEVADPAMNQTILVNAIDRAHRRRLRLED